jgi:hypothetical protein
LDEPDLEGAPAAGRPAANRIEQAIVLAANGVWAIVGLALWIPQVVGVMITSATRLVHATLTRQPVESIRGPIRRVSRFYVDGFLSPGKSWSSRSYTSRELRVGRFLIEAVWVAVIWLLILWLISKDSFDKVWGALVASATWMWRALSEIGGLVAALIPEDLGVISKIGTGWLAILGAVLVLAFVGGFLLGRRRR